jgi:hypothetical protein
MKTLIVSIFLTVGSNAMAASAIICADSHRPHPFSGKNVNEDYTAAVEELNQKLSVLPGGETISAPSITASTPGQNEVYGKTIICVTVTK